MTTLESEISETGSVAVIVDVPSTRAVTRPDGDTDAVELLDVTQLTRLVRFDVVPSENRPVAVSCCDSPFGKLTADDDSVSESSTAGSTVTVEITDISEDGSVAVIVDVPVVSACTRPDEDTEAD